MDINYTDYNFDDYDGSKETRTIRDEYKSGNELPFGNKPFGRLLILKRDKEKRDRAWYYCKCLACNTDIKNSIRFDVIKALGKSPNCNCSKDKQDYVESYIGRKFGYLVVEKYAGKNKYGVRSWQCLCTKCNKEHPIVQEPKLNKASDTKMCKKCTLKSIQENNKKTSINIGDNYGRLTVLRYDRVDYISKQNHEFYLCKCRLCNTSMVYDKKHLLYSTNKNRCSICGDIPDLTNLHIWNFTIINFSRFCNGIPYWNIRYDNYSEIVEIDIYKIYSYIKSITFGKDYYNNDGNDRRLYSPFLLNRMSMGWSLEEAQIIPPYVEDKEKWYNEKGISIDKLPKVPVICPISFN